MDFYMKLVHGSVKHVKGKEENLIEMNKTITVLKEEEFGFQLIINGAHPFFCKLGKRNDIHWKGLGESIRIEIELDENLREHFKINFLGYVKDDEENLVGDPILNKKSLYIEKDHQMLWIEGKIPKNYDQESIQVKVKAFYTKGYEREQLLIEKELTIKVIDYVLKPIKEGPFFLDLWQHLCNWARAYDVAYFSDEHFEIIENYIKDLSHLGQRVIDLIVTDYSWAGQRCYEVQKNHANLFEMNIVKVSKNREGKLCCDFSSLDRYVDICLKHGIKEEINLFGLIGNWDAFAFGNPVKGYKDAIRIIYYDERESCFDYIKSKEELRTYLSLLFRHLIHKGLWDKVKIISDEPNNIEIFKECGDFLQSAIPAYRLKYKCALHHQEFFERYGENIESLSLNTCELVNNISNIKTLKEEVKKRDGFLTWYSCCFPEKLNIFLNSPLLESRLKGWFTYYFEMDGFLRWAYGIWPGNVFEDARYKSSKWKAGDMFFVYPGKDLKPMQSVRLKNFLFGIQDFNLFKEIEESGKMQEVFNQMEKLLGKKKEMVFVPERSVKMEYSLESEKYDDLRNDLIQKHLL
ncbi:DUF4091 domain-containing protein [Crassaminicella profunda]|uniref:DUF4091 domain-containing protein n=1 Tax=Crassaminicella profunda TaxID=1286698 RepID=UPI001CA67938|nr:DUF4091 domain-containing protein [Crassaminicella profunda]QZY54933.1 DUF4091 domain-containing protein [Crassaminicella profunda]